MQSMCIKRTAFVALVIASIPSAFLFVTSMYDYKNIFLILFIFPVSLLFSLITYKMRDEVFRAWIKFATWWVPIQILLVTLTPDSSGGYFVVLVDKQLVAIILSGLFTIISILLIAWKYLSTRRA